MQGILERLNEGLEKRRKEQERLQEEYLKPLGEWKKYDKNDPVFKDKLQKLYEGGRTVDAV